MEKWKSRVYESYMSNGFGNAHRMRNEFKRHEKYFRKNYLRLMPENKGAKILELGCGMGHFFSFCKNTGYKNYEGVDASIENIEFIKSEFGKDSQVSVNDIMTYLSEKRGGGYLMRLYSMMLLSILPNRRFLRCWME